jgi:hypothetical protein
LRELIVDVITVSVIALLYVMYYELGIGCLALLNVLGVSVQSIARSNKKLSIIEHALGDFPGADYTVWAEFSSLSARSCSCSIAKCCSYVEIELGLENELG